jgi:hypothetical protein
MDVRWFSRAERRAFGAAWSLPHSRGNDSEYGIAGSGGSADSGSLPVRYPHRASGHHSVRSNRKSAPSEYRTEVPDVYSWDLWHGTIGRQDERTAGRFRKSRKQIVPVHGHALPPCTRFVCGHYMFPVAHFHGNTRVSAYTLRRAEYPTRQGIYRLTSGRSCTPLPMTRAA